MSPHWEIPQGDHCRGAKQPPQGWGYSPHQLQYFLTGGNSRHQSAISTKFHCICFAFSDFKEFQFFGRAETSMKQLCFWRDVISWNICKPVALKVLSQNQTVLFPGCRVDVMNRRGRKKNKRGCQWGKRETIPWQRCWCFQVRVRTLTSAS